VQLIVKNLSSKDKWDFLFPPGKSLTGAERTKIYSSFQDRFKQLASAGIRDAERTATAASAAAARTRTDATRKDAAASKLDRIADAKTENIASKQKQQALGKKTTKKPAKPAKGGGGPMMWIVLLIFLAIIVIFVVFGKRSEDDDDFAPARYGSRRYGVGRDDAYFDSGPFWYEGRYYRSEAEYYSVNGHHYTNAMYLDNYDRWGRGQGRDAARDDELWQEIEERADLREMAAEEADEADELRADAEDLDQDAAEAEAAADELAEALDVAEEEPDFEDDDGAGDEPAFEDDEPEEEDDEPAFEDDEPAFEDDEPEEEEEE
jgi:hypothetical protein